MFFDVFWYYSPFTQVRVCDIDSTLKAIVFLVKSLQNVNEANIFLNKIERFYTVYDLLLSSWPPLATNIFYIY